MRGEDQARLLIGRGRDRTCSSHTNDIRPAPAPSANFQTETEIENLGWMETNIHCFKLEIPKLTGSLSIVLLGEMGIVDLRKLNA